MSMLNTSSSWHVGRAAGRCAACGVELTVDHTCWAALCDGLPMKRPDQPVEKDAKREKGKTSSSPSSPASTAEPVSPFVRIDFCDACWLQGRRPAQLSPIAMGLAEASAAEPKLVMFSYWKTTVQPPQQKKKLLVDDSVLADVFQRMEGKNEPQEVRFRFVLALILMRKRLLKYEGTEETPPQAPAEAGAPQPSSPTPLPETWRMLPKAATAGGGWGAPVHVINPHLTAEQITEVSQQLSAILAEEV